MNHSARVYLALVAIRNLGVAVLLLAAGKTLRVAAPYGVVFSFISPDQWAVLFGVVGAAALGLQVWPTTARARGLIIASSSLAMWWAFSIAYGASSHHWMGGITALLWAMLAAKDTVFASQPLLDTDTLEVLQGRS